MGISFSVNNQRTIVLDQEYPDANVTVKHFEHDGSMDSSNAYKPYVIPNGQFVMLLNLYRHIMDHDIQNDFINPNGKKHESLTGWTTVTYDAMEQHDGFAIRRVIDDGRPQYVAKIHKGEYTFTNDHTYARHFTESTALKHILVLAGRDSAVETGAMKVISERRHY